MNQLILVLSSTCLRGLIFSIALMGMFITSRILKFDDLTIEGSFGIGAALTTWALLQGIHPIISIFCAMLGGGLAGLLTATLHTKLKLNHLISGIVVTTGLFSICLKVAGANASIHSSSTIFQLLPAIPHGNLLLLCMISIATLLLLRWFLKTECGITLKATGSNQHMMRTLGKNTHLFMTFGLVLANMLHALAGSLFVQSVGFFSIWGNVGVLVIVLAGLILAEAISQQFGIHILFGAILYQVIITTTFELQLDQDWNKCVTALLIILLIIWKKTMTTDKKEQPC